MPGICSDLFAVEVPMRVQYSGLPTSKAEPHASYVPRATPSNQAASAAERTL
jgi:hypothetical protein